MVKRLEILGVDSAGEKLAEESADRVGSFLQKLRADDRGDGPKKYPAWFLVALGGILQVKAWEKSPVFRELLIGVPSGDHLSRHVHFLVMRDDLIDDAMRFSALLNMYLTETYALSVLRAESKNRKFELLIPTSIDASIASVFAALVWDCRGIVRADESCVEVFN